MTTGRINQVTILFFPCIYFPSFFRFQKNQKSKRINKESLKRKNQFSSRIWVVFFAAFYSFKISINNIRQKVKSTNKFKPNQKLLVFQDCQIFLGFCIRKNKKIRVVQMLRFPTLPKAFRENSL